MPGQLPAPLPFSAGTVCVTNDITSAEHYSIDGSVRLSGVVLWCEGQRDSPPQQTIQQPGSYHP